MKGALRNDDVVFRLSEDTAFLWAARRRLLATNRATHAQRARLDMRLDARIEALFLAGDAGWEALVARFRRWPCAGALFALAAHAACGARAPRKLDRVLTLAEGVDDGFAALVSAIGWTALATIAPHLERWALSSQADVCAVGIAGLASHRRASAAGAGTTLGPPLRSKDARLRAVAAKAIGELGEVALAPRLAVLLNDDVPAVRFEAARAHARFGLELRRTARTAIELAEASFARAADAVALLALVDAHEARARLPGWWSEPATRLLGIAAIEALGEPSFVPQLVSSMDDDAFARAAGEAFRTISGADLEDFKLARPRPSGLPGDPADDADDRRVALDLDYELPFPSSVSVARFWATQRARFIDGRRYLDGVDVATKASAPQAMLLRLARSGRARHQAMAARLLAHEGPRDRPLLETHAPATNVHPFPAWGEWTDAGAESTLALRASQPPATRDAWGSQPARGTHG